MKILVVSQYYYPEPFRIDEICEELVRRGHDVTVLTALPNYPEGVLYPGYNRNSLEETYKGVHIIRCNVRPRGKGHVQLFLNYLSYLFRASWKALTMKGEYDCVFSYQLSPITSAHPAIIYGRKHNKPVYLYCLDLWPESVVNEVSERSFLYKLIKKYSTFVYKKATKIAVTSPSFAEYLSNLTGIPANEVVCIPQHSQDISKLGCIKRDKSNSVVNIVFLGNIGESQNVHLLLKAVKSIKTNVKFHVHIVGSGSFYDEIERLRQELGLTELVTLHGRQPKDRMPYYYAMADICYLSLRDEGLVSYTIPGKLQEYMSAKKAIVAAIKGDAKLVVEEAECGIVVGNEDDEALTKALVSLIEDQNLRVHYGCNARAYYEKHFTLCKYVDQLEGWF